MCDNSKHEAKSIATILIGYDLDVRPDGRAIIDLVPFIGSHHRCAQGSTGLFVYNRNQGRYL